MIQIDLSDKVALVVGGGSGIGRESALILAKAGASIAVADVNEAGMLETLELIKKENSDLELSANSVDLSSVESIQNMVDSVVQTHNRIDIFVNSAGICKNKPFVDVTEDEYDLVVDVNQKGTVFCTQAVAKHMISRIPQEVKDAGKSAECYGKIINFSSISGRAGRPLQIHYATSKAGIISATKCVAMALAPYGINVNAIAPSVVETPMWAENVSDKKQFLGEEKANEVIEGLFSTIPLKRLGTVEEMGNAVLFFASSLSDYVTGQTLNVDGGCEMN